MATSFGSRGTTSPNQPTSWESNGISAPINLRETFEAQIQPQPSLPHFSISLPGAAPGFSLRPAGPGKPAHWWRKPFDRALIGWFWVWGLLFVVASIAMAATHHLPCRVTEVGTNDRRLLASGALSNASYHCKSWRPTSIPRMSNYTTGLCSIKNPQTGEESSALDEAVILQSAAQYAPGGTCVDFSLYFYPTDPLSPLYVDQAGYKPFTMFRRFCLPTPASAAQLAQKAQTDLTRAGIRGETVSDLIITGAAPCVARYDRSDTASWGRAEATEGCLPGGAKGIDLGAGAYEFGSCNIMFASEFAIFQNTYARAVAIADQQLAEYFARCPRLAAIADTCRGLSRYTGWRGLFYACGWLLWSGLVARAGVVGWEWWEGRKDRKRATYMN